MLCRSFRIVPLAEIDDIFFQAVADALRAYELDFWEEFYMEGGEGDCISWMLLVGLYEPGCLRVINALRRREKGRADKWSKLTMQLPRAPQFREDIDFTSDEPCGTLLWFASR
jgi:hypothetical protein